jgi:hypothetical protein
MGKQLVEVWNVEPATGKIEALMVKGSLLTTERR